MRHRKKKTVLSHTGVQKKSLVVRNLLTSFLTYGKITTTAKRAFVLKSEANIFLHKVVALMQQYDDKKVARREAKRYIQKRIFGDIIGKRVVNEIVPACLSSKKNSFVVDYKLGQRKWDAAEEVLLKLEY